MQNLMFKKDSDFGGGTYVKEATCKNKAWMEWYSKLNAAEVCYRDENWIQLAQGCFFSM